MIRLTPTTAGVAAGVFALATAATLTATSSASDSSKPIGHPFVTNMALGAALAGGSLLAHGVGLIDLKMGTLLALTGAGAMAGAAIGQLIKELT